MAQEDNWLSFSLSPMAMLNSSTSQSQMLHSDIKLATLDPSDSHQYYLFDNFYTNGWPNTKPQMMYSGENQVQSQSMADSSNFVDSHLKQQSAPKLEDFLGGDSASLVRYSESQTETQDSELTHIYGSTYFNDQQDLKTMVAFQAFSTNSSSEVDDSASVGRTQLGSSEFGGQCFESRAYSQSGLSLGVNGNTTSTNASEKAIVAVESDTCKKIADTFGQRTSIYRGVTRHRWTGRYEAHLWDNSCRREGQARKGRQVYLGGYDKEDKAARAYDLAALKYWGSSATTNFPISNYAKEVEEMKNATKQEFIASLRRKSSGFSRGASIYRGVTRHHQQGRWQARIGRVAGNKDLYLGTFATEEEAAEAYDIAAIKFRGLNAVTNFEMNKYDVEAIAKSELPIGSGAKRLKISLEADQKASLTNHPHHQQPPHSSSSNSISFAAAQPVSSIPYGVPYDSAMPLYYHHQQQQHQQQLQQQQQQQLYHHLYSADSDASGAALSLLPPPAEFFIWPHQSY